MSKTGKEKKTNTPKCVSGKDKNVSFIMKHYVQTGNSHIVVIIVVLLLLVP